MAFLGQEFIKGDAPIGILLRHARISFIHRHANL
jgi:hypothetical protein